MQWLHRVGAAFVGLALIAGLSACGSGSETSDAKSSDPVTVEITFKDGKVTPNGDRVEVKTGQPIDLVVTADEAGEIHMHTDPEHEFAYKVGTETFKVEIDRPGVVVVESHKLDKTIVSLEVKP
ncbi:MAG: cupredoxin domain-containing protein [Nocardioidaceae bacterium]|nr:cupredoxin domain-containing protein [Nocardioidaceae bacterium]